MGKHKVFAYITHGERLLLFSHPFSPEAGIQVPAGTVEKGEAWETAVLREAYEETGLPDLKIVRHLGDVQHQPPGQDEIVVRRFYHLRCRQSPPERWWHGELYPAEGRQKPIPFELFWARLPHEVPVLAPGHGHFLTELMANLEVHLLSVGQPLPGGSAVYPERVAVNGRVINLRPLNPAQDANDLHTISHGNAEKEAIWTYMGYGPFADRAAMQQWLDERALTTDPLFFTVRDNQSGQPLGMVSYLNIVPEHRRLELGHIWYGLEAQHTQVNTETIYLMLKQSFEQWGYRRVEWKCDALNGRSRRAALRLGFQYEGLFRQHVIVKGRNRDTTWFAMMDHEWPQIKANMERWLSGDISVSLSWLNGQR